MGYTPAFDSIYTGSLYGRWPAAAVWASLLPLMDAQGRIDMSLQAIAGMTGWPLDLLTQGVQQLTEPDEASRTPDHDGRRLLPIDPARPWGWIAVNHGKYREKARLAAKSAAETASGKNAQRMADRRRPPATADDPLSNSDADTDSNKNPERARGAPDTTDGKPTRQTGSRLPEDFALTAERRRVAEAEHVDPERTFAKFCDHWRAASGANARKRDWDAAWRNWCRTEADRTSGGTRGTQGTPFADLTEAQRKAAVEEAWERQRTRARGISFRMPLAGEPLDSYRLKVDEAVGEAQRSRGTRSVAQLLKAGGS